MPPTGGRTACCSISICRASGQEILARVREMDGHPPVVIITAYDTPETRAQSPPARPRTCKPLDGPLLLNAITAALGRSAARR